MALNVTSCFRGKNGHDGTTMTVEFYSPRAVKEEREREKRNTFKKLHFSFFPIFFLLLLINISKVVVLFYCCILFDDIGNFIDFASTRFEAKIAFFSNSIISVLRKKKENFYIIFQKKKNLRNFEKSRTKWSLRENEESIQI